MTFVATRHPGDGGGVGRGGGNQVDRFRARHQRVDGDHLAPLAPLWCVIPVIAMAADPEIVVVVTDQVCDGSVGFISHDGDFIDIVLIEWQDIMITVIHLPFRSHTLVVVPTQGDRMGLHVFNHNFVVQHIHGRAGVRRGELGRLAPVIGIVFFTINAHPEVIGGSSKDIQNVTYTKFGASCGAWSRCGGNIFCSPCEIPKILPITSRGEGCHETVERHISDGHIGRRGAGRRRGEFNLFTPRAGSRAVAQSTHLHGVMCFRQQGTSWMTAKQVRILGRFHKPYIIWVVIGLVAHFPMVLSFGSIPAEHDRVRGDVRDMEVGGLLTGRDVVDAHIVNV